MSGVTREHYRLPRRRSRRDLGFADDHRRPRPAAVRSDVPLRSLRAKRLVDITIAGAVLIAVAIPMLVIALAIKLDSRGPVFYRVRRVGFRGRPLYMLKFRKMHHNAGGMPLTAAEDARLTRVGGLLTRWRLDELPQFWDVLRGRMSIVGPRPEDPAFVALHGHSYLRILSVRPGITGLSQLAFAEERRILDPQNLLTDYTTRILPQKVDLDILYANQLRVRGDLRVVVWTVVAIVLRQPVAVHRSTGGLTLRRRPAPRRGVHPESVAQKSLADAA